MASKYRGWTIVLHDAQKGSISKSDVNHFINLATSKFSEYVIAQEPYPDQPPENAHVHVFIRYTNTRFFKAVLSEWVNFWGHGRVQVDRQYGAMSDGCKYIMEDQSKKDKFFDPSPIIMLNTKSAREAQADTQMLTAFGQPRRRYDGTVITLKEDKRKFMSDADHERFFFTVMAKWPARA